LNDNHSLRAASLWPRCRRVSATSPPDVRNNPTAQIDGVPVRSRFSVMKSLSNPAWLAALAVLLLAPAANAQGRAAYEGMVATHARANNVPEALVHRVIVRESRYRPDVIGRGGTIGLMQIKLATARGLGYAGDAAGLRDPDTNLAYGIKYLAGAYRTANGDHGRAVQYYASGYYYAAKRQRPAQPVVSQPVVAQPVVAQPVLASAPPDAAAARPVRRARKAAAESKAQVPWPLSLLPAGTKDAKPR
jgi:soluble lytic murein transglycosylase-like protein